LGKSAVNFTFACLVLILAAIAAASYFINSERPAVQPTATEGSTSGSLPKDHPDINVSQQITALNQMIAKDPNNPALQAQMGNLYYDIGQYETAANHYQRSLDLRPKNPNVETDLAVCLHYLGQDDRALEILDKILAYSPGFTQAMFNKGVILTSRKKDVKAGISVWEDLLRMHPDYAQRDELEQRIDQLKGSIR